MVKACKLTRLPTESSEQIKTVLKFSIFYPKEAQLLIAIPNGLYRRPLEAIQLKREGLKPGAPDLMLLIPRGGFHGLCLEMKRLDGGVVSAVQRKLHKLLSEQGYKVDVAAGSDQGYKALENYLKL